MRSWRSGSLGAGFTGGFYSIRERFPAKKDAGARPKSEPSIGRNRALEVLLSSEDIRAEQAEAYGYINRALPDAELDAYVEALATRIAKFDKWAIANTKRLVNASLPPDVEIDAGWDACIKSLGRPVAQEDQSADGARIPEAGGCRKSARILSGPNRALGRRPTRSSTSLVRSSD